MQFLFRKNILLWLCENFLAVSFGIFSFMEVGAKEIRRFPCSLECEGSLDSKVCIPLDTAVSGQITLLGVSAASFGRRENRPSARSRRAQERDEGRVQTLQPLSLTCLFLGFP